MTGATSVPSPYVELDRAAWSRLRRNQPLALDENDLARLSGLGDRIDLREVEEVYLPLSRPLNFYVGATRQLPIPVPIVRALVAISYRLRLQPTDPGWVDMALLTPVMGTDRIRALGWEPQHSATDTLRELVHRLGARGGLGNALHRSRSPLE